MITKDFYAAAYDKGFQATFRFLRSKGLPLDEAEEYAQAAWARGWEAREQLKEPSRLLSWINSIALNTMFNAKRRAKRYEELHEERELPPTPPPPVLCRVDASRLLRRCSGLDRSLLVHRYAGGLEMNEIARRHGISCIATRVRIHRSKQALRDYAVRRFTPVAA